VMSVVNWWKNHRDASRPQFFHNTVRWNFLRFFGKRSQIFNSTPLDNFLPHFIRNFPTRPAQILHTNSLPESASCCSQQSRIPEAILHK
jgi:hypothetical protein